MFQVELIGEDCVRLYQNGADIRPQLGGVKSVLNLSNTQAEKTDNLSSISEDQVIDYVAGIINFRKMPEKNQYRISSVFRW